MRLNKRKWILLRWFLSPDYNNYCYVRLCCSIKEKTTNRILMQELKSIAGLLLFLVSLCKLQAQNLLANPSFEDENYCEGHIPCSPSAWFSVSNWPAGYFKNIVDPYKGKQSLGFVIASGNGRARNYWQTKLLCQPPEKEALTMKFVLYSANNVINRTDFGFAFIDNMIRVENDSLLFFSQYNDLTNAVLKQQKNGWYEVEITCTVPSHARYIIFGNFDTSTIVKTNRRRHDEYYMDQVSLTAKSKAVCDIVSVKDSLYSVTTRHMKPKMSSTKNPVVVVQEIRKETVDTFSIGAGYFDTDSSGLKDGSKIDSIFTMIDPGTIKAVYITAFTDKTGSNAYNKALSLSRAEAVRDYLLSKYMKDKDLIYARGTGVSTKYVEDKLNRRVEIIVIYNTVRQ